ncbi:MAG: hypothetical protein A2Z20_12285 [Bdellovibrionales bacterium RBG_16_40_8]|nr:MAG: hypothetical protein A2Z20_12285 [Bdellovibrionales bacterium RBG_16_40_8]
MKQKPWCLVPVRPNSKAKIDKEDYARVMKHTWRILTKESGRQKVVTNIIDNRDRNRQISLGQFLMKPVKGKMVYPRRFMEGLDYRKENLVVCTMQERQRILPPSRNYGTSRYKGVSYITSRKRWRAAIKHNGHSITLGLFKNEDDAAKSYNQAALKLFGKESYQNQIASTKSRRRLDRKRK